MTNWMCILISRRVDLLGETDVDQALDPSPLDLQSLRDQDLPRMKNLGTYFGAPCLVASPGEDDLLLSQCSGVTGYEEKEQDEIEDCEEEW